MVVRASPVLFKLPGLDDATKSVDEPPESKENQTPSSSCGSRGRRLPYRSVFAVLTTDSILVYDTHHSRPLSVVRGLHYAGLSDCQWSTDGMKLVVSSIDGYVSIVSFENGELGEVYSRAAMRQGLSTGTLASPTSVQSPLQSQNTNVDVTSTTKPTALPFPKPMTAPILIPPCEPGQSATIEAPPSKRAKKTRVAPTLISAPQASVTAGSNLPSPAPKTLGVDNDVQTASNKSPVAPSKRSASELLEHDTNTVGEAVTKLTLNTEEKPKKKKRIQPMLVSAGN